MPPVTRRVGSSAGRDQVPTFARSSPATPTLKRDGHHHPEFHLAIPRGRSGVDRNLATATSRARGGVDRGRRRTTSTRSRRSCLPVAPAAVHPPSRQGMSVNTIFTQIGCDGATSQHSFGPSPIAALAHQTYQPFSDFLVHDMGRWRQIPRQRDVGLREMRTAPLWWAALVDPTNLLHDGARHVGRGRHPRPMARARRAQRLSSAAARHQTPLAFLSQL